MSQIKGSVAAQNLFSGGISDGGKIAGTIAPGGVFLNDYVLKVSDIEDGHRLTITRGNEVQVMDIIAPETGKSAYDIAVEQGFRGTEAEWVASLQGKDGKDGKDAEPYTLPVASADMLGGVKVGDGLQMDGDVLALVQEPELELLETIVCDGTYSNIGRTNLSLKRVVMYINTKPAEAAASIGIEVYNGKKLFGYLWIANGMNTGERWMYVNAVSDGKGAAYLEGTGAATSSYGSTGLSRTAPRIDGDTPITRVGMYSSSGAKFPEGSTIEIWGVRANA